MNSVPRIFTLTGPDQLIPHFTSVERAMARDQIELMRQLGFA